MLKGSVRQVLSFIAGYWMPLLQLSIVPMAVVAFLNFITTYVMRDFFVAMLTINSRPPPGTEFTQAMMRFQLYNFFASMVTGLALTWLFVRLVRYYVLGELSWVAFGPGGAKPIFLTFLYGLGILLLTFAAYVAGIIVVSMPIALIMVATGAHGAAPLFALGVIALLVFLPWFFCRFAVGLPAVALGQSPDFFKGIWPLARFRSWGLPLRFVAAQIVYFIALVPVYGLIFWNLYDPEMLAGVNSGGRPPAEFMVRLYDAMAISLPVRIIIEIPVWWFFSLLLAEAYRRFSGR